MRISAGVVPFVNSSKLGASAYSHSKYMYLNSISGHIETSGLDGFTGVSPVDRSLYQSYPSRVVGENISTGNTSYQNSIDLLFSAIYHRNGFLNSEYNEIGIGIKDSYYTYNLGNSALSSICYDEVSATFGFTGVCANPNVTLSTGDYFTARDKYKLLAPKLITWPPEGSLNIPPVFFEESPDPLPSSSVSGYPVSVTFNNALFSSDPIVESFTISDGITSLPLEELTIMNKSNDPNGHFSASDIAFFPKKRLEWGTPYISEIIYTYNNIQSIKSWCFQTRSLNLYSSRFYRIDNTSNVTLTITSGTSYSFYIVPRSNNDSLGGGSWERNTGPANFSYIDKNTFSLSVSGQIGQTINFTFNNGQKINLTISDTDSASIPTNASCTSIADYDYDNDGLLNSVDLDDDNDGYSDIDELHEGSNPLDVASTPLDTDDDKIPNYRDPDDDNDGISDVLEVSHGLNPLNQSDGASDLDGDGFSNAIEISIGTNIRQIDSSPIWAPIMVGDIVVFSPAHP